MVTKKRPDLQTDKCIIMPLRDQAAMAICIKDLIRHILCYNYFGDDKWKLIDIGKNDIVFLV